MLLPTPVNPRALKLLAALIFALPSSVLSDSETPSGVGCADPQGLVDCYNDNVNQLTSCTNAANNNCGSGDELATCLLGCANYQLAANVGCWLQSCWNQVYSCDFQTTVINYIDGADRVASSVTIPYYPPPDDAPGACSCNLGVVYEYMSEAAISTDPCISYAASPTDVFDNCQCCYLAAPVSNIINTCPKSNLSILGVPSLIQSFAADIQAIATTDPCKSALGSKTVCPSQFNITAAGDGSFVDPAALPSGVPGTEPLSTLSGTVTALPGPQTFTLELFPGYTSVITMASLDAQKASQTATPTAGSSASASGGSQTGSPSTTNGNGSVGLRGRMGPGATVMFVVLANILAFEFAT